ncbi:S49 family peptidase [Roseomonas gilardii subsp. gilardii]|uniref:S49 family peptidase n=1 Tax=Roseomonas gilardii TaxID=257708 RepID=UPI001FF95419|nr:S49 family peptidase [Roseomonas gilardii]UPG72081.1 S49 family peptidase [Roseomonas gilardii subsp. gilardii]
MPLPFFDRRPRVAVIRMSGVIAARATGLGGPGLSAAGLAPVLERAFGLKRLAGVVLAINSPGGSPVQSSLIAARIVRLADEKDVPVIACIEDAGASGGYWIACAADEIVCDPASITGSIGVISQGFGFQEAIERLGVERRVMTAGENKSFLDPFLPPDPAQQKRLRELLDTLHEEFKDWVRSRRANRLKAPEGEIFSGRFWTGREAVALGLADRLGDLYGEIERRFGKETKIVWLNVRRPRWPWRLFSAAVGATLEILEERSARARLGL